MVSAIRLAVCWEDFILQISKNAGDAPDTETLSTVSPTSKTGDNSKG